MTVNYVRRETIGAAFAVSATADWASLRGARGLRFERHAGDFRSAEKRLFDVIVAAVLLAALMPVFVMIALFVRLDSPGPIFIRQERVGRHFRPFYMLKFRSMVVDAELRRSDLLDRNEADGPIFKIRRDPRITRVGSLLRRWSVDELPQLMNVLRGEMSLVGPRPPFPGEVGMDHYRQGLRLRCTPGMTGIWQISGRSDVGYDAMVEMDLRYLRDASFITDLSILLRTIPAVVSGKGAW